MSGPLAQLSERAKLSANGGGAASFDLQAFRAAKAEAVYEPFQVVLGVVTEEDGTERPETISIPPLRDWTLDSQAKMSEGDIIGALEDLVGAEQAMLFRKYRWTMGEFEALFDALGKWSGFQMGQSVSSRLPGPASHPKSV